MKRIILTLLSVALFASAKGQSPVSYLNEDFNTSCASPTGFPTDWSSYNPVAGAEPAGVWSCAPDSGRNGTPGITCTNVFGSTLAYNVDTSYLITPLLNLAAYAGQSLYLDFDTKISDIYLAGSFAVYKIDSDTSVGGAIVSGLDSDLTDMLSPLLGTEDEGWVTHQLNIAYWENTGSFYLSFKFIGSVSSGVKWYLDNVNITTKDILHASSVSSPADISFKVLNPAAPDKITILYDVVTTGTYSIEVYDMVGRQLHKEDISASQGSHTCSIQNLNLTPGMYLVRLNNPAGYAIAKAVVE